MSSHSPAPLIEASESTNAETRTFHLLLCGLGAAAGNYLGGKLTDRAGPKHTPAIVCLGQRVLMPLFSVIPWNSVIFAVLVAVWSVFALSASPI